MGRRNSESICPKCGKQGFRSDKSTKYRRYRRFVHYDHVTRKRQECNVEKILRKRESDILSSGGDFKLFENQTLPTGELCDRINKFNYIVDENLYRLGKKIDRFAFADSIIFGLDTILFNYLGLYAKGYGFFPQSSMFFLDIEDPYVRFKKIEKYLVAMLGTFVELINREYSLLLRKGSLLDQIKRSRYRSKYKMREELRAKLESSNVVTKRILKRNDYKGVILSALVIYLANEYLSIKYELPSRLEKRRELGIKLSESGFGSDKYDGIISSSSSLD